MTLALINTASQAQFTVNQSSTNNRRRYTVQVQATQPREMNNDCVGRALWPQVGQTSKNRIQPSSVEEQGRCNQQSRSTVPLPLTHATSPKISSSITNLRQLVEQAHRQDGTPKALLQALRACPEVARRMMATVNSGRFGIQKPVTSLLAAHVLLGQNTFRQLVLVSASLERTPLAGQ